MPDRTLATYYRDQAERCRLMADEMPDADMATKLREIAQTYDSMARQMGAMARPSGTAGTDR
jgi:vacuolar-type H+-ATPase catalytic subunit A/Vma1